MFYWPPNSNLQYIKQLKKFLHNVHKATFEQVIILGDFNLPHIDWYLNASSRNDEIYTYFTKLVEDNLLRQLIDFRTRKENVLDLLLTNIPDKIINIF